MKYKVMFESEKIKDCDSCMFHNNDHGTMWCMFQDDLKCFRNSVGYSQGLWDEGIAELMQNCPLERVR